MEQLKLSHSLVADVGEGGRIMPSRPGPHNNENSFRVSQYADTKVWIQDGSANRTRGDLPNSAKKKSRHAVAAGLD